jgi:hypothetical protein
VVDCALRLERLRLDLGAKLNDDLSAIVLPSLWSCE